MLTRTSLHNFTKLNFTVQKNKPRLEIVETLNRVLSTNLNDQKLGTINVLDFSPLEFIYNAKVYS